MSESAPTQKSDEPSPKLTKLSQILRDGIGIRSVALTGLLLLALLYTLYFAKSFILPIVLALLLSFLLTPTIRFLKRVLHFPEYLGAGAVMLVLVGVLVASIFLVAEPASNWLQTLPGKMPEIEYRLRLLKKPLEKVTAASAEVEKLTEMEPAGERKETVKVQDNDSANVLMTQTPVFLANTLVMFILLYFLLASGDQFLRKLVTMIPTFRDKRRAVEIAREIEDNISKYLQMTTRINACMGLAIGIASYFVGLQNYILWAVLAFLLNYIPYLGALVGMVSIFLVGLLTFESTGQAFVMPGIYLVCAVLEGNFLTPMIMGRFMTLNPVAIFISLMFWGWIWGVFGALLAVPLLAVVKIFCDHIEPLEPVGEFLAG